MPKCLNDPSKNYKGNEPSPKGLGYCAHAEKVGSKMKGKDGNFWIVKEDKNKVKRWYKDSKKTSSKKDDKFTFDFFYGITSIPPKDINKLKKDSMLKKIIENIIPKIKKFNIETYLVPLPLSDQGHYWSDYPYDYIEHYYNSKLESEYIYFKVYLNQDLTINYDRDISIHYELDKSNAEKLQDFMHQELPNNFKWDGNLHKIMEISYETIKKNTKSKIDNSSDYPNFYVSIRLNIKKKEPDLLHVALNTNDIKEFKGISYKFDDFSWGMDDITINFYGIKEFSLFEKKMKQLIKNKILNIKNKKYDIKKISISGYLNENDGKNDNLYRIK